MKISAADAKKYRSLRENLWKTMQSTTRATDPAERELRTRKAIALNNEIVKLKIRYGDKVPESEWLRLEEGGKDKGR